MSQWLEGQQSAEYQAVSKFGRLLMTINSIRAWRRLVTMTIMTHDSRCGVNTITSRVCIANYSNEMRLYIGILASPISCNLGCYIGLRLSSVGQYVILSKAIVYVSWLHWVKMVCQFQVNSLRHCGCQSYLWYGELGLHQCLFVSKSGFVNSQFLPNIWLHITAAQ